MYIYLITNLINNKKYVGSTNNVKRRWREHIGSAKWPSCQSYYFPLQCAIRKYGEENFKFEVIEENIPLIETPQKEQEYIIKYNSLTNTGWGYNQTLYTDCALQDPKIIERMSKINSKRCALVDSNMNILQIYNSLHEACRINFNINEASMIREVCLGKIYSLHNKLFRFIDDNDQIIIVENNTRKRRQGICGFSIYNINDVVYYDSILEASQIEKIERRSLQKCLNGETRYSYVNRRVWRRIDEYGNIIENSLSVRDIIIEHNGYCSIDIDTNEVIYYLTKTEIKNKENCRYSTINKYLGNHQVYHRKQWYKLDEYGIPMKGGDNYESVDN